MNDNDDVSRDENIRLYVNAVSYHVKDDKYKIQIVDVDSIPLIDIGQMDAEIKETFDDLSSTLRFDNVQKYGLMAATFQFSAYIHPSLLHNRAPTHRDSTLCVVGMPRMIPGSLRQQQTFTLWHSVWATRGV